MENLTRIQKFYYGKNIFVTGATGFIGKLLVEKLLRSCPGIQKFYLLVRDKKGKSVEERFDEILQDSVFDRLKRELPEYRRKITLIPGDCSKPDLGLSDHGIDIILKQANIIFHSAATVKFNEPLRNALYLNVRATGDLLKFAQKMRRLDVFMHVSTAYCNPHIPVLEEKIYPVNADWREMEQTLKGQTEAKIERTLPEILGPWPNTYTFTKALAEEMIMKECENMPVGVFRPAMVISTANEPIKNWVDNKSGPTGVVIRTGMGVFHTLHCDGSLIGNLVPADYMVNCLIAAAVDVHTAHKSSSQQTRPLIYNYTGSEENPITWNDFKAYFMAGIEAYPFSNALRFKFIIFNKNAKINAVCNFLFHLVPALLADVLAMLELRKPTNVSTFKKLEKLTMSLTYFTMRNFKYSDERTRKLWDICSNHDKQLFPFNMATFNWNEYFKGYVLGIRRYALKENDEKQYETAVETKVEREI